MRTEIIFNKNCREFVVDASQFSKAEIREIVRTEECGIPSDLKLRIEAESEILKESNAADHVPTRYQGHKDKYVKLKLKHTVSGGLKYTLYREDNRLDYSVIVVFHLHRKKLKNVKPKAQAA
ncbi:MAG TPA: hypothetical protein VNZ86_01130 [Bacteroidia bacterium]|jgi:hypothetical protein|nr:hypothetical protein [Bacteroidia bacterium]